MGGRHGVANIAFINAVFYGTALSESGDAADIAAGKRLDRSFMRAVIDEPPVRSGNPADICDGGTVLFDRSGKYAMADGTLIHTGNAPGIVSGEHVPIYGQVSDLAVHDAEQAVILLCFTDVQPGDRMPSSVEGSVKRPRRCADGDPVAGFAAADPGKIQISAQPDVISAEVVPLGPHVLYYLQALWRIDDIRIIRPSRARHIHVDNDHGIVGRVVRQIHDDRRIRIIWNIHYDTLIGIVIDIHDDLRG